VPELPPHPDRLARGLTVSGVWTVNSDGGSRGNPGPGGAGIVVRRPDATVACRGGAFLGTVTNNVAEYEALLWGLRAASVLGADRLRVLADSELIVKQMRGEYRVKNKGLQPLFCEAQALRRRFAEIAFEHVVRAENADADALANEAMDRRDTVGDAPEAPARTGRTLFDEGGGSHCTS
jgi:ribonuclease HI